MKLKFLLQKNAWFIEHERRWYCIQGDEQVRIASSSLPLGVVDQETLATPPHLAGVARLENTVQVHEGRLFRKGQESASVRVTLTEPDGAPVLDRSVVLDAGALSSVEWKTLPFRDGWLEASSSIVLDHVDQIEINAFLPALAQSSGKALIVHNETSGTSREVWLERTKNNVVPLLGEGERGHIVLRLECEPEPTDTARDPRRLGFVLSGESVEAA